MQPARTIGTFLALALAVAPAGAQHVYWATEGQGDRIQRADLDGENVEDLVFGLGNPNDIILDLDGEKMYWSEDSDRIQRANLDGSEVEVIVDLDFHGVPVGLAVDSREGKLYWTEFLGDRIRRANLDGTDAETVLKSQNSPAGIDLDLDAGKMYWCAFSDGEIRRANLDGTGIETVLTVGSPAFVRLDLEGGKLYYTHFSDEGSVLRANLDGSGVETIVPFTEEPLGLGLDLVNDKVYWVETVQRRVNRANLDGSQAEQFFMTEFLENPVSVAVDPRTDDPDGEPTPALTPAGVAVLSVLLLWSMAVRLGRTKK